jgi:amino acid transporter
MLIPIIVFAMFMIVHVAVSSYSICILRRWRDWRRILSDRASFVSATLLLFYMLYLYLVRSVLEVFNCVPSVPPDGQLYLQATFEPCGVPGGTQVTLLPWAVIGLIVYGFGYPAFLAQLFWRNRCVMLAPIPGGVRAL